MTRAILASPAGAAPAALAIVAICAAALGGPARAAATQPLTNEDIVRLVMNRTSEKAVLQAIADRTVDFDLGADVVEELRLAGVSDRVIEAMRRRQAAMPRRELPPVAPSPVSPAPAVPAGSIVIAFDAPLDPQKPAEGSAVAVRKMPKGAPRPPGLEVAEVTDLALAVLCTTPDHVPDHWDSRTPIPSGPRHEVILFHPGSRPAKVKSFDVLYLDREGIEPAPLAPGRHTLLVGLAGRQAGSGSWKLLASDTVRVEIATGQPTRITLSTHSRVRGTTMTGYDVQQEWKVVSVEPPPPLPENRPLEAAPAEAKP